MLPMAFNRKVLETLFTHDGEAFQRVLRILQTVLMKRVVPYFKRRGTDATLLARGAESTSIQRLEDEEDRISLISLLLRERNQWTITIHERVFDYLAFVIPGDPESRLGGGPAEESKMLAFSEFLLRHQVEHILFPEKQERDVIRADVAFAVDRRTSDPTYYKMLGHSLSDEMNGIEGSDYLALFGSGEQGRPLDRLIAEMINPFVSRLCDMPGDLLRRTFPALPRQINEESRVGEMLALGVDPERGMGSIIPVQATPVRLEVGGDVLKKSYLSVLHATGNIQTVMDESRKVATTGILHCADALRIDLARAKMTVHLHLMGGSTRKDGPSAGGAIALALASAFSGRTIRRDVAMTGEIDTQGRITGAGGLHLKLETSFDAGCRW